MTKLRILWRKQNDGIYRWVCVTNNWNDVFVISFGSTPLEAYSNFLRVNGIVEWPQRKAKDCQMCKDARDGFYGSYAPQCKYHNEDGSLKFSRYDFKPTQTFIPVLK